MRRLLVAAAVSLASASEPFSWADAQNAMHSCTNGSKPLVDKYAYLSTRHALGNALSGWMHVFMYALASGRQPVVGSGPAPRLMCGRERTIEAGKATLWYGASGACRIIGDLRAGTANRGVIHHHGHCYDGWWNLDGTRTVPPQPVPKRRRGPGPRGPLKHHHPAGPRKHRDPERARARARAASGRAAARPHHSKWSPRDVAAAIADEVGRNEQKA